MKKISFLFLLSLLSTLTASAHDIEVKNADGVTIYYNYINDGTELEVSFRGSSYSSYANEYKGIVVIPEEVTYMGRTRKVTSIGGAAFAECNSLTSVTFPNSVTSIAGGIFYRCTNLTSITLPNSIKSIGSRTFYECSSLTSVTVPNSVTNIGDEAFYYCEGLTSVTIGNSVKSMGEYAFSFCSKLTSVTIPNSMTSIGEGAFKGCSALTSVHITDIAAWCKIQFNFSDSNPLSYANHLFMDGKEITDLVIPNNVTSIGNYAFLFCSGLTSVTIPNSVTSIGNYAFWGCSGLTSITIPNSVTSIGGLAFQYCSGLTSITIGNSVTSIGSSAFEDCSGLTSVTIPNSVTSIGDYAFRGCSGLTSVTIGNSVTSIGNYAFQNCSGLTSVTIPNSVTSIGQRAFDGADIPNVVSLIENPYKIVGKTSSYRTFSQNTFNNATLYVPVGTKNRYKATDGWKDFFFIEEGEGPGGDTPEPPIPDPQKCATPTITYENGKLTFSCATEGATCQYTITDTDIKAGSGNEVQLTTTYIVSVYATKAGFENSDVATKEIDLGTSGIRGDVNLDNEIGMPDVMFIVNYILNGKFPDEE